MSGRPLKVIGGSKFHTQDEHAAVGGRAIYPPLDLPPQGTKFWNVVALHLWEMALASYADWPELRLLAFAYSDWTKTGSQAAGLEFSRLCAGFCLEPATMKGPLSKFGIQVRTNPTLAQVYHPDDAPYAVPDRED